MAKPPVRRSQQGTPQPSVLTSATRTEVRHHSGPLPTPEDLARYDQLIPGAAERIIVMAENEQRHRTSMEQATLVSDQRHREAVLAAQEANARGIFRSDLTGQLLGGAVALGCVGGAIFAVMNQQPWYVVSIFLGLPVVSIIKAIRSVDKPGTKKNGP